RSKRPIPPAPSRIGSPRWRSRGCARRGGRAGSPPRRATRARRSPPTGRGPGYPASSLSRRAPRRRSWRRSGPTARVIAVQAFGTSPEADATVFATLAEVGVARDRALSITAHAYDPWALDGAKTIAFEIAEALDAAPDRVYVPAGGGGLALSIARGFREWQLLGRAASRPHFAVVQAEGCAPVVASW